MCVLPRSRTDTMAATSLPFYYHGTISKQNCEEILGKKGKDGAYLIRDSETIQGALCLCVYKKAVVYTYRLLQTHTGHYTLQVAPGVDEMFFKSLDDLVRHFKRRNQGLAMHLRHAVKRKILLSLPPPRVNDEEEDYENVPESSEYVTVLPY